MAEGSIFSGKPGNSPDKFEHGQKPPRPGITDLSFLKNLSFTFDSQGRQGFWAGERRVKSRHSPQFFKIDY